MKTYLITGGCGFIGSALVRRLLGRSGVRIVNVDKLTYAGNPKNLAELTNSPNYVFYKADISDRVVLAEIFAKHKPAGVLHLAAESHVDRSIDAPADFIQTNIVGTYALLEESLRYFKGAAPANFRFLHISTDEVFGSLEGSNEFFEEHTRYDPRSPYSASKASSDHLVRAWHHTFGLPILMTNCGNNFGPYQYPEKLIPVIILNAVNGSPIPIYGDGRNQRDWIYVDDHARALELVMEKGQVGQTYLVSARNNLTNLEIVEKICAKLDKLRPRLDGKSYSEQIKFVTDRPGHDFRYAIDPSKIETELGYRVTMSFEQAIEETIRFYLETQSTSSTVYAQRRGLHAQVATRTSY